MAKKQTLKAVDFFCCAGGVTCGFRMAGIKVLGGIDIEGAYKQTYETNNIGSRFIQADISKLSPADLERKFKIKKRMDHLIFVGCSPCQYYTSMQTDKSKSAKGKMLLEDFKRFVDYFLPGYIFIENVQGIETKSESPLSEFKEFLRQKKYVIDDKVVNAAEYGVPQNRRRYVMVASRVKRKQAIAVPAAKKKIKTVRDVIADLPVIPANTKDTSSRKHWTAEIQPINLERLQNTPHNGGTRLAWKGIKRLQLPCYIGKDDCFPDVYGRLHWDRPAPTITTKFYSISNGRFGHPVQNRALSIREGADLQSFPRSYKFFAPKMVTVARMIGNAVPPELSKHIGMAFLNNYQNASISRKGKGR